MVFKTLLVIISSFDAHNKMNQTNANSRCILPQRSGEFVHSDKHDRKQKKSKGWIIFEGILLSIMVVGFFLCFTVLVDEDCNLNAVQALSCIRGVFSMYSALLAIGVLCVKWISGNLLQDASR